VVDSPVFVTDEAVAGASHVLDESRLLGLWVDQAPKAPYVFGDRRGLLPALGRVPRAADDHYSRRLIVALQTADEVSPSGSLQRRAAPVCGTRRIGTAHGAVPPR
jgi:hypothetical protein